MKRSCALFALLTGFVAAPIQAQGPLQPFGVDAENLDVSKCNHTLGACPLVDMAAQAGAQWMRLFPIWHFIQPNAGTFDWGELPWQVWYAQQHGIQVYFTPTWAPQWANGATSTCPPYAGANQYDCGGTCNTPPPNPCQYGYRDVGYSVRSYSYTYNFFYNLALQFNGSDVSGCPTNDASHCHPLVQYFGVWNEPDGMNNFNVANIESPSNYGNYLNDYAYYYLFPAHDGVKAANPAAYVVAPELGTGSSVSCGGFSNCPSFNDSWMKPIARYFSTSYDIVSIHGYHADYGADTTAVSKAVAVAGGKPVWLTETSYPSSPSYVVGLYNNLYRYLPTWNWTKAFYQYGGYEPASQSAGKMVYSNDGSTLLPTAWFSYYQTARQSH